jgi:hypothetical protein
VSASASLDRISPELPVPLLAPPMAGWCQIWHHRRVASAEKIERKARASPKSLTFTEACTLAEAYFGKPRQGSGSHIAIYKMPWQGDPRINLQKGEGGKAKEYQIKQLIKAIDKQKEE